MTQVPNLYRPKESIEDIRPDSEAKFEIVRNGYYWSVVTRHQPNGEWTVVFTGSQAGCVSYVLGSGGFY